LIQVNVRNNDVQYALREFKKKVKKSGILEEVQSRQHFVPKTQKRKMKQAAARRRK
jgi:small subunit ribosomal protein S21